MLKIVVETRSILLVAAGLAGGSSTRRAVEEIVWPLDMPDTAASIRKYSPSAACRP